MICPRCYSGKIIKNGSIYNGKQKYICRECEDNSLKIRRTGLFPEKKELINRLLIGKISLSGIG